MGSAERDHRDQHEERRVDEAREKGIGHSSWVLTQRPSMGVMLNPYRESRYRRSTGPLFGPHDVLERSDTYLYVTRAVYLFPRKRVRDHRRSS